MLNAAAESARYSKDFDFFHDAAEAVAEAEASEKDRLALTEAGFEVLPSTEWEKPVPFRQATIRRAGDSVEIDWAADSPHRFFPVEPNPVLGWKLHLFDMATNKALA